MKHEMIFAKAVPVLLPANKWFGMMYPSCANAISAETETAYLVCPFCDTDPDLIPVDPEAPEYRDLLVKLFVDENGLYATPYFPGSDFGRWGAGGAYILVPLDTLNRFGCGYALKINNTAVPLRDFWEAAEEPKEIPRKLI